MNKKIPLFLSILTCLCVSTPVSAVVEKGDVTYWSISEMAEFKQTVDAEVNEKCHGDFDCEDETRYTEYYSQGGQYRALENFDHFGGFSITNINPGRGTITVRYTDLNSIWMHRMGIEREPLKPSALYIIWVEDGMNDPFVDIRYMREYEEQFKSGNAEPGLHVIVAKNNLYNGSSWLPEGEEITFEAPDADLPSLRSGKITHDLIGPEPSITLSIGFTEIGSCINSPDYELGMDCKKMFGSDGSASFLPLTPADNTSDSIVIEPEENATATTTTEDGYGRTSGPDEPVSSPTISPILSDSTTATTESSTRTNNDIVAFNDNPFIDPSSPNTGIETQSSDGAVIEFPWWLGVILAVNGAILIRFFWPMNDHKGRKNHKFFKK